MNQPTIEDGVNALISDVKNQFSESCQQWENSVRRSPQKAIAVSMAAGYLLHRLPVRAILMANVRILAALAPPAMLAFGAAKMCEFLQEQARSRGGSRTHLTKKQVMESNFGASTPGF